LPTHKRLLAFGSGRSKGLANFYLIEKAVFVYVSGTLIVWT